MVIFWKSFLLIFNLFASSHILSSSVLWLDSINFFPLSDSFHIRYNNCFSRYLTSFHKPYLFHLYFIIILITSTVFISDTIIVSPLILHPSINLTFSPLFYYNTDYFNSFHFRYNNCFSPYLTSFHKPYFFTFILL